ncbi:hypothetical protein QN224_31575, partial [Sinorhizobium sp. 8-89]|uniref:M10 family metallopeptidase n=1 Tax=Sinorhizobium sp. 7-81 TaxID=3049087 RepID=UPI0024C2A9A5
MVDTTGQTIATAGSMVVGDEVLNTIETAQDSDWFAIELIAGVTYSINLTGDSTIASELFDCVLAVYDSSGTYVGDSDDTSPLTIENSAIGDANAALSSFTTFTASYSGTYYLAVDGFENLTGNYRLSVYQDDIPESIATPASIAIGGQVTGTTVADTNWDDDWYQVNTVADQYYTVTLSGSGATPLTDLVIELRDSAGGLIDWAFAGSSDGVIQYTFQATHTSYFLSAGAEYNTSSGQYTLQVDVASPTDAIEWNEASPSTINVYFVGGQTDVTSFTDADGFTFDPEIWFQSEIDAAVAAFATFSAVTNVQFNYVDDPSQADFMMVQGDATEVEAAGYWNVGGGIVTIDGVNYAVDGAGVFNWQAWNDASLAAGGDGFYTLIHEIGHGMGLAHPHDAGGGSAIMAGVTSPFDAYGDFLLNQGIYTMMSYNPGFDAAYGNPPLDYGSVGGPMALDIAVLQQMYGANTSTNSGDTTYFLPSANGPGTYFQAIWDTGGTDKIQYTGTDRVQIDLRAATLRYEIGGGGFISAAEGIFGGFTIANGVVIENAQGGSGADYLFGNGAANNLNGGAGADNMRGLGGNDTYVVDNASDIVNESLTGSSGTDTVQSLISFSLADTTRVLGTVENLALLGSGNINGTGSTGNNVLTGNAGANVLNGGAGADNMRGLGGNDTYVVDNASDIVNESLTGSSGTDTVQSLISFSLADTTRVLGTVENLALLGSGNINGTGSTGNN